jgi:hypothetical protein
MENKFVHVVGPNGAGMDQRKQRLIKRKTMRSRTLLSIIAVTVAAGINPAKADHAVACGQIIESGSHVLQNDLECHDGSGGITLRYGAELDLDRHTVTCGSRINCIVLEGGSEVHGGTVIGGQPGILLKSGSGNYVHDMRVIGAYTAGILAGDDSVNGMIIDNEVTDSKFESITVDFGSYGNQVSGNSVKYGGGDAINIRSDDNFISGNTSNNNDQDGMVITGFDNDVVDNTLTHNGVHGIFATGPGQINIIDNFSSNNMVSGIRVGGKSNVILEGNLTIHNDRHGIDIVGTAVCPVSGPDRNKSKGNGGEDFIGCPSP